MDDRQHHKRPSSISCFSIALRKNKTEEKKKKEFLFQHVFKEKKNGRVYERSGQGGTFTRRHVFTRNVRCKQDGSAL